MSELLAAPPVIIIGAARSGTNMLRDVISALPGYGTWPCDEINYIWRHGNARFSTDEFRPEMATPPVRHAVQRAFAAIAAQQAVNHVVEKTCANSLRVGFVNAIFPEARFIFIMRDGRDVVASAMKRWSAPLDLPYLLRKARYVPLSDLPYYGFSYLGNRIHRLRSNERRLKSWGPRFKGMQELLQNKPLVEVCAAQWQRSVERAEEDLAALEPGRCLRLNYETFVAQPSAGLQTIVDFLGEPLHSAHVEVVERTVSSSSVGKWRAALDEQDIARIAPYVEPLLLSHGYL